jgi:hypothetical protein
MLRLEYSKYKPHFYAIHWLLQISIRLKDLKAS